MESFYSIGLDLGTNSVGWAAVGNDNKVIKHGGKHLWGTLLFDEGKPAQDTRMKRSMRRRLERRRERIELLRMLMEKSINEVDDSFFRRLDMSFVASDEKDEITGRSYRYNIFNGDDTDKEYYTKYPTIYHLRHKLATSDEKADIRLIYLALHHIVKYRGNFLRDEEDLSVTDDSFEDYVNEAKDKITSFSFDGVDLGKLSEIILNDTKTRKDRVNAMQPLFDGDNKKSVTEFCKLLLGMECNLDTLFRDEDSEYGKIGFDKNFEDRLSELETKLPSEYYDFVTATHDLYLTFVFAWLLEGYDDVSSAMIAKYDKHKKDLQILKNLCVRGSDVYRKMFKYASEKDNYVNYIKYTPRNGRKSRRFTKRCEVDDFYKYVSKVIADLPDSEEKAYVAKEIELKKFLPRLNTIDNGAIPYQINKNEMIAILDRQSKYYPELKENHDKIVSILTFRRPYSVGPLKGKFSWIDQKIDEKVRPWNFNDLVDVDSANDNFIKRMVGHDKFTGEPVLPLASITYQTYVTLNEINNLRYKGNPLGVDVKQKLFDDLIKEKGNVKIKDVRFFLKSQYNMPCDNGELKGNADDEKLNSSMKTYVEMKRIFGDKFSEGDVEKYDKIVEILTVFNERSAKKRMLKRLLTGDDEQYIDVLSKKQYKGWGKYSTKLLRGTFTTEPNKRNILDLLYQTDKEINGLLYDEGLGLKEQTVSKKREVEKPTYEDLIEPLYASPAVKKIVWQAVKITREVAKILQAPPRYIFIESTHTDGNKGKKPDTRLRRLQDAYKNVKADCEYYNATASAQLSKVEKNETLNDEKVYLYYRQLGRCMYSGEKLDLNNLSAYQVDHILPQSYIKDDSLENKALVKSIENQRKSDNLVLKADVINRQKEFWKFLLDKEFITKKKYYNLIRTEFNAQDFSGFINRQLVETNQANKSAREVLYEVFPELQEEDRIRPLRAGLTSQLRHMMTDENPVEYGNFYKLRDLNDLHHAKDAYLACVLGIFTTTVNPSWGKDERALTARRLLESGNVRSDSVSKLVNERYGIVLDSFKYGEYDGKYADRDGIEVSSSEAYNNMLATMDHNDCMVVHKKEFWANPDFYNQTLYSAKYSDKNPENLSPLKYITDKDDKRVPLNTAIYGGFSGENTAYYLKVEYTKDGNRERVLAGVPTLVATRYNEGDENAISDYLNSKYAEVKILGEPIRKYQHLIWHGQHVYLSSHEEMTNAVQLVVDKKYHRLLKYISKGDLKSLQNVSDLADKLHAFILVWLEKMTMLCPVYSGIAQKVSSFVSEKFDLLSLDKKVEYIKNLLTVSGNSYIAKAIPELKINSSWGKITNRTIYPDEVTWIDESITGYYVSKKVGV